jgi:hypothetical protein
LRMTRQRRVEGAVAQPAVLAVAAKNRAMNVTSGT